MRVDQFTGIVSWDAVEAGNQTIEMHVETQVRQDEILWNLTTIPGIPGYNAFLDHVSPGVFPGAQPIVLTGVVQYVPQTKWEILGLTATPNRISLSGEVVGEFEEIFCNVTILSNDGPGDLSAVSSLRDAETIHYWKGYLQWFPNNRTPSSC